MMPVKCTAHACPCMPNSAVEAYAARLQAQHMCGHRGRQQHRQRSQLLARWVIRARRGVKARLLLHVRRPQPEHDLCACVIRREMNGRGSRSCCWCLRHRPP